MNVDTLLELVSNPDKFKKALQDLEDRKKALDETIAIYGEASKIPALKAKAEAELADAQERAAKILADTDQAVEAAKKALKAKEAKLDQREENLTKRESVAVQAAIDAKQKEADAAAIIKEYAKKTDELTFRLDSLAVREQEVEERLVKLRSVMA
jgi:exonuclease VII small subunit